MVRSQHIIKVTFLMSILLAMLIVSVVAVAADGIPRYARKNPPFNPQDGRGWQSLSPNETAVFDVADTRIALSRIEFSLDRDVKSPVISVYRMLTIPDYLTEVMPTEGEIYEYVQFKYTFFTKNDIAVALYSVKVEKEWFEGVDASPNQLTFYAYDERTSWKKWDTEQTREDDLYYYFNAEGNGLNYFALGVDVSKLALTENIVLNETSSVEPTEPSLPPPPIDIDEAIDPFTEEKSSLGSYAVLLAAILMVSYYMFKSSRQDHKRRKPFRRASVKKKH